MTYGVYLRCVFCKKREWLGSANHLPPQSTWDEPNVSIFDIVEMRGRRGMPLVCASNWIYPHLKEKALQEFQREHKQMIKTLTHSGTGKETLKELEKFYGDAVVKDEAVMGIVHMEGIGDVVVPKEYINSFAELSRRVAEHEHKYEGFARDKKTPKIKMFTIQNDTPQERWRVYWNRLNVAYGYLEQNGVIVLINKYGSPIPNSSTDIKRAEQGLSWRALKNLEYLKQYPEKLKKKMAVSEA